MINEAIFDRIFRNNRRVDFRTVVREIEVLGGLYGIDGFHKGFGQLLSNMLTSEALVKKDGTIIIRISYFIK